MATDESTTFAQLKDLIARFSDARDWAPFHTPKNLSMAVATEAAELMEIFRWTGSRESIETAAQERLRVKDELADVLIFCLQMATVCGVDLAEAVSDKMERNEQRYSIERSRGNAEKVPETD